MTEQNHPPVTFECEIQARLRDVNLGGHVDNVEAIRVLDEARLLFLRYARVSGVDEGVLQRLPDGVLELVGSQRVDYRAEMRFVPFQPFLVRMWVGHTGRASFTVSSELRVAADHPPAVVAETGIVLWDGGVGEPWPLSADVQADLTAYAGTPVALRDRPAADQVD